MTAIAAAKGRQCQGCSTSFEPGPRERNPKKWCSDACRAWSYLHPGQMRPTERACAGCSASMGDKPMQAKYCSTRCREIASGARLAESLPKKVCELADCEVVFQPRRVMERCCSEKHGKVLWNRESRADGRQKPEPWTDARRDRYHRRRAQKKAASTGEPVLLAAIAERDNWRCSLCLRSVDPAVSWPDSQSPSLDHRVPLSKGGAHDPSNVFLAHLGCNSSKGDRLLDDGPLLTG